MNVLVDFDNKKAVLVQQEHLAFPTKTEVGYSSTDHDLPKQLTTRIPHTYTVITTAVYVAVEVTLDPIRNTYVPLSAGVFIALIGSLV